MLPESSPTRTVQANPSDRIPSCVESSLPARRLARSRHAEVRRIARNILVFVVSSRGQPATLPAKRRAVSFWQLEPDPSFPGRTFSGFGRYALLQVLNPTARVQVVLDFTTSSVRTRSGCDPAAGRKPWLRSQLVAVPRSREWRCAGRQPTASPDGGRRASLHRSRYGKRRPLSHRESARPNRSL